jgi:hypothetical protein
VITDAMLADLRTRAEAALTDTCTVQRLGAHSLGPAGAEAATYGDVLTGVPCMLRPAGVQAEERALAGAVAAVATWIVRLPYGTDVRASDRIVTTVAGETKTLEVLPPTGAASFEPLRQVACTEIT